MAIRQFILNDWYIEASKGAFTYAAFSQFKSIPVVSFPLVWFICAGENKAITFGCGPKQPSEQALVPSDSKAIQP